MICTQTVKKPLKNMTEKYNALPVLTMLLLYSNTFKLLNQNSENKLHHIFNVQLISWLVVVLMWGLKTSYHVT